MRQRKFIFGVFGVLVALGVLGAVPSQAKKKLPTDETEIHLSFAPLVKAVAPAVVNIYTKREVERRVSSPLFDDPFFKHFFGDRFKLDLGPKRKRVQNSLGSGVILDQNGLIVTNHHVIAGADEITVAMSDRTEYDARLVLADKDTDLAVLSIDPKGRRLPFVPLRDSDELEVGDLVLAIGNPFNVGQTVTSGIVSALARTGIGVGDFQFFIQTDAAINPGNSGGALIGMDGRLIGVNTAIYSQTGGSHGIGFAIPANMVQVVLESARAGHERVRRPWLGMATQTLTPEIAEGMNLGDLQGVVVTSLYPDGPADKAGLRTGDIILMVDGRGVASRDELRFRIGARVIGGVSRLDYLREGRERSAKIKLISAPEQPPREMHELGGRHALTGLVIANLSPAVAVELNMDETLRGVVVMGVASRSPAGRLGLKPGDRILQLNGEKVTSVRGFTRLLAKPANQWRLAVQRGNRVHNLVLGG